MHAICTDIHIAHTQAFNEISHSVAWYHHQTATKSMTRFTEELVEVQCPSPQKI